MPSKSGGEKNKPRAFSKKKVWDALEEALTNTTRAEKYVTQCKINPNFCQRGRHKKNLPCVVLLTVPLIKTNHP